jgi:phenylalanyl-tRNA synthetase beta chain
MPLVTFDYNDFLDILGYNISKKQLIEKLPMIGADLDRIEGNEISIEFFPNRPDLTSVEGIARASRAFFDFERGITTYNIQSSDITLTVDSSVKQVRPFVVTALLKNVTMTDELISSLMNLQEKLHFGLGRNRKKVAIGVHNFEAVVPPFVYKAVDPDSVQFVPLAKEEYMTLREILERHEKGIAYAHILKDAEKYPLIVDSKNNVLSFPPIINGRLTEITPYTNEIFIDVTGTDRKAINIALNIVTTALAERSSQIFNTTVIDEKNQFCTPDLHSIKRNLSTSYVNAILGVSLTSTQIIQCLGRMGFNASQGKNNTVEVETPAWRSDILHDIDLVEDVAVGYGFDNFKKDTPKALTFGGMLPLQNLYESLRTVMIGLGFNEVTTFTISNPKDEFINMGLKQRTVVTIENPIGEEYSSLRSGLLPSLLKLLRENRHHSLPQQIFELGIVVDEKAKNRHNLAGLKIDAKANFTECKSIVEAVLRNIKCTYKIKEKNHGAFVKGRCAAIMNNNKEIGFFGELHPRTIQAFYLEHPIIAFEIQIDLL